MPDDKVDAFVSVLFDNKMNEVKTQLDAPETNSVELRDTKIKYGKKYQFEFSSKHNNLTSTAFRYLLGIEKSNHFRQNYKI